MNDYMPSPYARAGGGGRGARMTEPDEIARYRGRGHDNQCEACGEPDHRHCCPASIGAALIARDALVAALRGLVDHTDLVMTDLNSSALDDDIAQARATLARVEGT